MKEFLLIEKPNFDNTSYLDRLFLHKVLGLPIFIAIMYLMFTVAMNIGCALQPLFDITTQILFIELPRQLLVAGKTSRWVQIILLDGIGRGVNVTFTFIPVLACMFALLAWLEQSGYVLRAALVVDRIMQLLSLPGKSLVTMVMGFGCNVPAVMGTRTIENRQERILTILMTPFMSCGARLGVYAVFAAAFFEQIAHKVIFSLYLLGLVMAVLTALVWRSVVGKRKNDTDVMELPPYRWPSLALIWCQTWSKLKQFLFKAGIIIVPLCVIIGVAGEIRLGENAETPLEILGKKVTPMFSPLGITEDNWPATVGLFTGMLAKEVVVGTLNSLYAQTSEQQEVVHAANAIVADKVEKDTLLVEAQGKIVDAIVEAKVKIFSLKNLIFSNPLAVKFSEVKLSKGTLGIMYERFHNQAAAFAYLIFILLYCPCVSVVAVIARELSIRWALFTIFWTTFLAYMTSVTFYQIYTFKEHEFSSTLWVSSLTLLMAIIVYWLRIAIKATCSNIKDVGEYKVIPVNVTRTVY